MPALQAQTFHLLPMESRRGFAKPVQEVEKGDEAGFSDCRSRRLSLKSKAAQRHQTPGSRGQSYRHSSFDLLVKEEKTRQGQQLASKRTRARLNLLIFLHTAIQYSSDSKLFRLPPQPPYIKRMHFFLYMSKYQRGITARQGPVIASWEQTAVWRWLKHQLVASKAFAKLVQHQWLALGQSWWTFPWSAEELFLPDGFSLSSWFSTQPDLLFTSQKVRVEGLGEQL